MEKSANAAKENGEEEDSAKKTKKDEAKIFADLRKTKNMIAKAVTDASDLTKLISVDPTWAWANNDILKRNMVSVSFGKLVCARDVFLKDPGVL